MYNIFFVGAIIDHFVGGRLVIMYNIFSWGERLLIILSGGRLLIMYNIFDGGRLLIMYNLFFLSSNRNLFTFQKSEVAQKKRYVQ